MLLSYNEIVDLINAGVITGVQSLDAVNAASLDVHLGPELLVETCGGPAVIDYSKRERPGFRKETIDPERGVLVLPGSFVLAQTVEMFHLPNDISAVYKLKSSMARVGLEHLNSGWCDAGWSGSVFTLALKNVTQFHCIRLHVGDSIGQVVFFRHTEVPEHASYANRGRYNGIPCVSTIIE